jgi:hypothetical protein
MAGTMSIVVTTGTAVIDLKAGEMTTDTSIKEAAGQEVTATEKADFKPNIYC